MIMPSERMSDDLLVVTNLTKRFATSLPATIENLSFRIPKGERVTVFGPSGAGKTTLLNILTGLDRADAGGFALTAANPATIFQEPRLFPYMTVEENIFLPVRIRQIPLTANFRAQYRRWLEVCELGQYTRHYPYQLSGGMKQKIALIRGFMIRPDFVMMDEPFKSIDIRSKQAIIAHILASHPGITVLFVTHTIDEIPLLTQSVLVFRANRLAEFTRHEAACLKANPLEVIYG
jgi:ABC-type nitrate/sulfonate/bicarbonate transport system ATPase subunit